MHVLHEVETNLAQGQGNHLRRILKHESIGEEKAAWDIPEKDIDCTKGLLCLKKDKKYPELGELEGWRYIQNKD